MDSLDSFPSSGLGTQRSKLCFTNDTETFPRIMQPGKSRTANDWERNNAQEQVTKAHSVLNRDLDDESRRSA
jgi:NADPH-dependent ferric siderophore reductase